MSSEPEVPQRGRTRTAATQQVAAQATPVGFEPTRGDPIGLAGRHLSRSAKVSRDKLRCGLTEAVRTAAAIIASLSLVTKSKGRSLLQTARTPIQRGNEEAPQQCMQATPVGFEPTRGDPIGLAGRRLSRSAKVSLLNIHRLAWACRGASGCEKEAPSMRRARGEQQRHLWDSNPRGETSSA